MRCQLAVIGAAAVAVASLALSSGSAGAAQAPARAATCTGAELALMVCYHEQARRRQGLPLLRRSARLDQAARLKARLIVRCHRFEHDACGHAFMYVFYLAGYLPSNAGWLVGENLAYGWRAPYGAFAGLMHSPKHRENILEPSFREIGLCERPSPWGPLWVVEYGRLL